MTSLQQQENLQNLLDAINENPSCIDKLMQALNGAPSELASSHLNNALVIKHMFFRLEEILQQWSDRATNYLSEEVTATFSHISKLILLGSTLIREELQTNTNLIKVVKVCLNSISVYGCLAYAWGENEYTQLISFENLIKAYMEIRFKPLLEPIFQCALSYFSQGFSSFFITQSSYKAEIFQMVTCPNYVLTCDKENGSYIKRLSNYTLISFSKLFEGQPSEPMSWIKQYTHCLFMSLRLIARDIRSVDFNKKKPFLWITIEILQYDLTDKTDDNGEEVRTWMSLIHSSVTILLEIARYESGMLNDVRENENQLEKILQTLKNLLDDQDNVTVRLQAFELIVLLVTEERLPDIVDIKKFIALFVEKFSETIRFEQLDDEKRIEKIEEAFSELQSFMQDTILREQLVKENIIPLLIQYDEEFPSDAVPLEIIYALMFIDDGLNELKKKIYERFIDNIRALRYIDNEKFRQAAQGIIWKLEGENNFTAATGQQGYPTYAVYEPPAGTPMGAPMGAPMAAGVPMSIDAYSSPRYHTMISYCWANKPLCHQIYNRLKQDGYNIWIDENEMHGSIIESMATGIEESEVIIMCMSSAYKKSPNCQAEAEYAYNRKKKIVPLIVESKYKADGWLGFIAGNKLYVTFAEKEGNDFEKAYEELIAQLERHDVTLARQSSDGLSVNERPTGPSKSNSLSDGTAQADYSRAGSKALKSLQEPTAVEYPSIEKIQYWNEEHVTRFLEENHLTMFSNVLKNINGLGLVELYHVYTHSPDVVYNIFNKHDPTISPGIFFKFIKVLKNSLITIDESAYF